MSPASELVPPLLRLRGIDKSFPGVHALRSVDLSIHGGEVLALMGENGAGKSTLIKVISGAHRPDRGDIEIDGRPVTLDTPTAALQMGIGVIYQEFNLVPQLNAWENIYLGRERTSFGILQHRRERRRAAEVFERLGVDVPLDTPCGELTIAQQQLLEIAKALSYDARLLVMDEPTAALTPAESNRLIELTRGLRDQGIAVIYISHRLDEVFALADRIMVMRDGEHVLTEARDQLTRERTIELMVGRPIDQEFPTRRSQPGDPRLVVKGLTRSPAVKGVSFTIHAGEVLGMTGLIGAGRTETARLLFGADRATSGQVTLDGRALSIRSPRNAIAAGVGLVTEDRKNQGLVLGLGVRENFGLPSLSRMSRWGFVERQNEYDAFARHVKSMRIKIPHADELARNLSGGNQQKVVIAKWLERDAEVFLFDEPTRGIDVGAKYEIYLLINELAARGKAILIISSELPEVLGMCDRVLVMRAGRIAGEISKPAEATQAQVMVLAVENAGLEMIDG